MVFLSPEARAGGSYGTLTTEDPLPPLLAPGPAGLARPLQDLGKTRRQSGNKIL